ncbi:MAG: AAA family ATPase [Bacteroidota bacterium]
MKQGIKNFRRPSFQFRLENFKLYADTDWFRLAPLTCLVGRNSSGKSSIINALLLLKQSLESDVMGSTLMPLSLAGPYCDLGNFSDVVYKHDDSSNLSISFSSTFNDLLDSPFDNAPPFVKLTVPRFAPSFRSGYYYSRFGESTLPRKGNIKVRLSFKPDEPFGPSLNLVEIASDEVGTAKFVRTVSGERHQHWRIYTTDLPPRSLRLRQNARTFFPYIEMRESSYEKSGPSSRKKVRTFLVATQKLFSYLTRILNRCQVIGPFRTPPERRYSFAGFSNTRVDPSGGIAVDLLITELLLSANKSKPLQNATSFWLHHLGLANSLNIKDIAKRLNLFEVDVAGAGKGTHANIVDVGFGISQVLPVIIQGLLMRPGGIYLVQQPEIHLHPDAQAGLADFFIYLASYGVITVVETHSEYLLLRLRRRLAEGGLPLSIGLPNEQTPIPPLSRKDVSVLLTDSGKSGHGSLTTLEIGDSFQFDNLPVGFMDQSLSDRLHLLKALGRKND